MRTPRSLVQRLFALVLTVALLVLASQVNKLPGKLTSHYDSTKLAVGQTGTLGTARVLITDVRLAQQVRRDSSGDGASRTTGTFVLVTIRAAQPGPEKFLGSVRAIGGGRTFNTSTTISADPSFESETVVPFEVPDENLPALKVTINPSGLILAYDEQLEFDLGLDARRIDELRTDQQRTNEVPTVPILPTVRGL